MVGTLIKTRAKAQFLLNVGPEPDGELPIEQAGHLREVALWMCVNGERIDGVCPSDITGLDVNERTDEWKSTPLAARTEADDFTAECSGLQPGRKYDFRAVARHPLLTV